MNLKTEQYKGYSVKFLGKIIGAKTVVVGEFSSKVSKKVIGATGTTKLNAYEKCKTMINKDIKIKGLKK